MTDTQAELARARLLRRQCQSAMTSEEADRMFARALQSEREAAAAEARRAAIEECGRWHEKQRSPLSGPEYGLADENTRAAMRSNTSFHNSCAKYLRALASPQEETR